MKRLTGCLMMIFAMCLITSFPAHADAIRSGDVLIVPIDDAREIAADNAALLAEVEATKAALADERAQTEALMVKVQEYMVAAEKRAAAYEKQIASERRRETLKIIGALVIGAVIGASVR